MASTAAYTTAAQVKSLMPRSYSATDVPATLDTTYTSLATHIIKASREVDAALAPFFCTFNATDHPAHPTPQFIQDLATKLAAERVFHQMAIGDRSASYGKMAASNREAAQMDIDRLMSTDEAGGVSVRSYVIGNETVDAEALTFGAGGEYDLPVTEAFINVHDNLTSSDIPTLLMDSVHVLVTGLTLYARGRDFDVRFDPRHGKWVFCDYKGGLRSSASQKNITYDWTWARYTEKQTDSDTPSIYIGGWQ